MALNVIELFGGIGAFTQAVKSLDIPINVVDYVEISPYSVKSYNAINGTEFAPQDITQFHATDEKYSNIDIIMHGSPCTSFSAAGKQEGGREGSGTASSLLYETVRIVGECKPKVVIWENVPMLISNKFKHTFMDYLRRMIAMGYRSYYKVLNAKDYGVPQNRERVFTISILGEHKPYVFPEKEVLTKRLIDLLEKHVDESYYLSDKMIEKFTWTKNGYLAAQKSNTTTAEDSKPKIRRIGDFNNGQKGDVLTAQSVDPNAVIDVIDGTKKGFASAPMFASIDTSYTKWNRRRGRVQKDVAHTLVTSGNEQAVVVPAVENPTEPVIATSRGRVVGDITNPKGGVWTQQLEVNDRGICNTISTVQKDNYVVEPTTSVKFRIRRLQPIECWRLMGFSDEAFKKASAVNSNSQLYSQAGNSICVPVLARIIEQLLKSVEFEGLKNNEQESEPSQS